MLSQCDPEKAPTLEQLLGEDEASVSAAEPIEDEDEDPRANVRAWMAVLGGSPTVNEDDKDYNDA